MSATFIKITALSIILSAIFMLPAQAEKTTDKTEQGAETKPVPIEETYGNDTPTKKINRKISNFMEKLDKNSMHHFMSMYTSYNIIETVKIVRTDVGNAITACGENNPAMKDELTTRFKGWTDTINPIMDEAAGNYNNMLIAQDYAPEKEIRNIYSFIDKTRTETNDKFKKIPVTSKEACTYLLEKMDETQPGMEALLQSTLALQTEPLQNTAEDIKETKEAEEEEAKKEEDDPAENPE